MDMDEMGFYSLNEQAIKQEIAYKKEKLSTEDILFSWVCTPKRFFVEEVFVFSMIIFPSLIFFFSASSWDGVFFAFFITVFMILFGLYMRFTVFQPKTYCYELTKVGIRYTIEENVHENFYKFSRAGGKLAAFVSVIAVIFLGPLALAGAGAGLLHARAMSNHRKRKEYERHIMPDSFRVRYLRERQQIAFNPRFEREMRSIGIWEYSSPLDIYIDESFLYKLFYYLKKDFNVIDIKDATDYIELKADFLD
ncbi:TPA: hypothetical protein I7245_05745 [Vibrio vulnificus]|uniref:hypothetical protein n=3 Tax=Vibrio vulnificus TaxID=672 RepID=UPI001034DBBF|nr:hypothetical protein [Vibrio vulnificus]MBN8104658.1 hypothetical protein [Vibrio vulnificus]MCJ0811361.1 hypothetical protein [Vibrio vulnificus]MDT8804126.1 hypothetical protein [Vibrio vulnificus]WHE22633.1 hypothetical protein PVE41_05680 [Vibrio vulnificus]HAS6204540.1 hypothetical protein [Vibrio vulnificus]